MKLFDPQLPTVPVRACRGMLGIEYNLPCSTEASRMITIQIARIMSKRPQTVTRIDLSARDRSVIIIPCGKNLLFVSRDTDDGMKTEL